MQDFNQILKESIDPKKFDMSTYSLLLTNLIVIITAVIQKWNFLHVIWLYFIQNLIIGFFSFLRIITTNNAKKRIRIQLGGQLTYKDANKYFYAFFFLFHYGFFHFVYLAFLLFITALASQDFAIIPQNIMVYITAIVIFFMNHLFSFFHNLKKSKEQTIDALMFTPYLRIFPMHLLPFVGGLFFGNFLISFFVLKTIADVITHNIELALYTKK